MTDNQDKLIIDLVNKGLDGDMENVNSHPDKIVRAKVKAMIIKVQKGKIDRPVLPKQPEAKKVESLSAGSMDSLSKEDMINFLVNKGIEGDMEIINDYPDKMVRAKAKAMIVKINKGLVKKPEMPRIELADETKSQEDLSLEKEESLNEKLAKVINDKFPGSVINNDVGEFLNLKPDNWLGTAKFLKSDPVLFFDSLQCQMGIDIGEGVLESRYNLHSMKHNHSTEIRISVPSSDPSIPSVEQVWRIADWFERETYDMLGIQFTGHRDLRRILLPDDWEGWPLRKDYEVQETYHGIVIPKMKEGWE
tara:strand:- start:575 stop:1492 length:918 start_codon:yes stop_codon:yes gene_type:complete